MKWTNLLKRFYQANLDDLTCFKIIKFKPSYFTPFTAAILAIGRFQKISIPIPRTAFRISEGEGEGGFHDYGILRAWEVFKFGNLKARGDSIGGISGEESVQ